MFVNVKIAFITFEIDLKKISTTSNLFSKAQSKAL